MTLETPIYKKPEVEPSWREDKNDPPVDFIKELGFDSEFGLLHTKDGTESIATERVFFVDSSKHNSFNATDEAIQDAILRWKQNVETLELYLANGKNNNIHEWTIREHGKEGK